MTDQTSPVSAAVNAVMRVAIATELLAHGEFSSMGNGYPNALLAADEVIKIIRSFDFAQTPIEAALRDAFPHFQDDAPITPEAIKGIGKEYLEMVMGWEPQKTEIEFADDDGNIRKIVYEPGEYESGSFPGWVLADDTISNTSTDRQALPIERACQCDSPVIRCDNRGCRCTICGELERSLTPNHREGEHQW